MMLVDVSGVLLWNVIFLFRVNVYVRLFDEIL